MANLARFKPSELFLEQHEAWQVLVYFFGGNAGAVPSWLTDDDRSFAQALLLEAVDASARVGVIQRLWQSTVTPPATIRGLLVRLARMGGGVLSDHLRTAEPGDLANARIYAMVKDDLTRNFRSAWTIRMQTGEALIY